MAKPLLDAFNAAGDVFAILVVLVGIAAVVGWYARRALDALGVDRGSTS